MRLLKSIALFIALVFLLLAVPFLLPGSGDPVPVPAGFLPWQIESLPGDESRVFGLVPGRSTLADVRQLHGNDVAVALIVAPGESGSLEAYYEHFVAGTVNGRLLLTLQSSVGEREAMLARAVKADFMDSTTRRVTLSAADLAAQEQVSVMGMSFIPATNLDEAIILERFGTPAERIRQGDHFEHFLYPDKGLDVVLNQQGKEVLQYVAPSSFSRLREPLRDVAAAVTPQR